MHHRNTFFFPVHGNNTLAHHFFDTNHHPVARYPKSRLLLIPAACSLSYPHLHFEDATRRLPADLALQITASAWAYATINGRTHSLDPDTAAPV